MDEALQEKLAQLRGIVGKMKRGVFFGGAGVSTESGIPDFRSQDGLYRQKYAYPPEYILSRTFFDRHTAEFFDFYRDKMLPLDAQPNAAHKKLAQWEAEGKLAAVVRQELPRRGGRRVCGRAPLQLRRRHQAGRRPLRGAARPKGARGRHRAHPRGGRAHRGRHLPQRLPRGGADRLF